MIVYEICFRTIATVLGAPILAGVVGMLVARSGSSAVSNTAIAGFLLTPSGLVAAFLIAMGYLVGQLVLMAGLMTIAAVRFWPTDERRPRDGRRVASSLTLFRLGIMQLIAFAWFLAVPWAGGFDVRLAAAGA